MSTSKRHRKQWTVEEKRQLIAEFEGQGLSLWAWAKGKGISRAWFSWVLKSYSQPVATTDKTAAPTLNPWKGSTEATKRRLIAEYDALPLPYTGERGRWAKDHGIAVSLISYHRRRFQIKDKQAARSLTHTNGNLNPIPEFNLNVLPTATPTSVVTLDDAIAAMQVRQDLFAEFLEMLKRMQTGVR